MKALLLNSGIGKRMGELTRHLPKCLVPLSDQETILSLQVQALLIHGIDDIIITTGPFPDQIKAYVQERFPRVSFGYVPNPLYDTTNYIYSLYLAKEHLEEDLILMHGDLVFDPGLLGRALDSPFENTVLVNPEAELPEKDFKARIREGRVREISVNIFDEDCHFLIPLYKLSLPFARNWWTEMARFVEDGKVGVYGEDALNGILEENNLYPVHFHSEICSEIDDREDLEAVRQALR